MTMYTKLWLSIIGLHALHQIEESISFFRWYIEYFDRIPGWLRIQSVDNAQLVVVHPEYFIFATLLQLLLVSVLAFAFRRNERVTRLLIWCYLAGLSFFIVWHILICYFAHSYAPIMVTCIGGLYLIPLFAYKLYKLGKR